MSDNEQKSPAVTDPDENHLIAERKAKLERLREKGPAFPNDFRRAAGSGICDILVPHGSSRTPGGRDPA